MYKSIRSLLALTVILSVALVTACSAPGVKEQALYDFGALRSTGAIAALPPVTVADVNAPAWLDSSKMIYRLAYANDQQMRAYAHSRWVMPPARLFEQRLKARIAQAGGAVLSASDGAANLPLIKIDAENFSQMFESTTQSHAHVLVRVSILRGRSLIAQKSFARQSPALTADAAGGAAATVAASDAVIADVMTWLAGQALK